MSIQQFWNAIFRVDTHTSQSASLGFMAAQGRVIEPIGPHATGRIQLQGVSWRAQCNDTLLHPLPVNTPVQVIARTGLVLTIRPLVKATGHQPVGPVCYLAPLLSICDRTAS